MLILKYRYYLVCFSLFLCELRLYCIFIMLMCLIYMFLFFVFGFISILEWYGNSVNFYLRYGVGFCLNRMFGFEKLGFYCLYMGNY